MDIVKEIQDTFKKFNSELYVIAIFNIELEDSDKKSYFVIAKHTPDKESIEEDPFYIYVDGKIRGITITDSPKIMDEFEKILNPKNRIYEID